MKKWSTRTICQLFPNLMARYAYKKMTHPRSFPLRNEEQLMLDRADQSTIISGPYSIEMYTWKGGAKELLLVHGWEGHAGNFCYIIDALLRQGFTIHSFDGPGHGRSSRNLPVTFFDFSSVVSEIITAVRVENIVCHSFGSIATLYALQNLPLSVRRLVLLTTPNRLMEAIEDAELRYGLTSKVSGKLVQRIKKSTGHHLPLLSAQDFVRKVQVQKALILHDVNDRILPIERSIAVNRSWPACSLTEIEGTGHFRMLRSGPVAEVIGNFMRS